MLLKSFLWHYILITKTHPVQDAIDTIADCSLDRLKDNIICFDVINRMILHVLGAHIHPHLVSGAVTLAA